MPFKDLRLYKYPVPEQTTARLVVDKVVEVPATLTRLSHKNSFKFSRRKTSRQTRQRKHQRTSTCRFVYLKGPKMLRTIRIVLSGNKHSLQRSINAVSSQIGWPLWKFSDVTLVENLATNDIISESETIREKYICQLLLQAIYKEDIYGQADF